MEQNPLSLWLKENSIEFHGKWVAVTLDGKLLATASDVFALRKLVKDSSEEYVYTLVNKDLVASTEG